MTWRRVTADCFITVDLNFSISHISCDTSLSTEQHEWLVFVQQCLNVSNVTQKWLHVYAHNNWWWLCFVTNWHLFLLHFSSQKRALHTHSTMAYIDTHETSFFHSSYTVYTLVFILITLHCAREHIMAYTRANTADLLFLIAKFRWVPKTVTIKTSHHVNLFKDSVTYMMMMSSYMQQPN